MSGSVADRLRACWRRSDQIFGLLEPEALYEQPIRLRHPVIFYLGHLPAFAWNQVCRGLLEMPSFHPHFDALFERGIDPMGVDSHESKVEWPALEEIIEYRDRVRQALIDAVEPVAARSESSPLAERGRIFAVAIEHELMHQETLLYQFQQLPLDRKRPPTELPKPLLEGAADNREIAVAGGSVVLGARFDELDFGWDNEFPECEQQVADFRTDRTPVRNAEFLEFVDDGGYRRPELWLADDWMWRERIGLEHPAFWSRADGSWQYHSLFGRLELESVADWPAFASLAEARAYCRWRDRRLPTEAELHRAAYSNPEGDVRRFPWGDEEPAAEHGNFDFRHWSPTPVGAFPAGDSAWGVADLVGNGWEWTDTVFAPFPGFEAYIPSYAGYSADFFDGLHNVMLGASWATPTPLIRRSFRNWFQGHYPYVFAKFRTLRS
jgi:ergothioneine biosynthesis protein EgtB